MGTPAYMAPEQADGRVKDIGPATDVYALGAILYELLTGRPPFTGESAITILTSIVNLEPVPPGKLRAHLPRDLETICLKCLNKEPSRRYSSALALAEDLHRFLASQPISARPARVFERIVKWGRRRPTSAAVLVGAILLALLAGAVGFWYWDTYYRVKLEYYAYFVNRWGVWDGVEPLSEAQARHRNTSYRISRRAGRVEKIEVVNGSGALTPWHQTWSYLDDLSTVGNKRADCAYEFRYNAQGELAEQIARDQAGQVVWTFHFTTRAMGFYADERGFPRPRAGSGAAVVPPLRLSSAAKSQPSSRSC